MSVQTLYVAHTAGTVLGSHTRSPWVAASTAQAASAVWDGQPVFTDRAEAFAWIEATRAAGPRWLDFAVASLDADTYPDPPGPRRVRIDYRTLGDPHRQVVRADTNTHGPHTGVLNALYQGVHEQALHEWWRSSQSGDRAAALADAVWRATYPIGFHDAAQVLAGRVGHAAHLLLTDPDPRHDLDDPTAAGLAALTSTAAAIASTDLQVPDPPDAVIADTAFTVATDPDHGWRYAVDRLWAAALLTAADDATTSATTALREAWRSHGQADTLTRQAFGGWLDRALGDTRQVVTDEWRHVCGQRPLRPVPAAARAYPALISVRRPSTADADLALAAAPAAVAALAPGRAR